MTGAAARRDVVAGVGSAILITTIGLLVVPIYVHFLGIEAYGLVGFLALLQGVLQLLDLGFAPTVSREVARATATGRLDSARQLLFSLSLVYWGVAALILFGGVFAAPIIANHWLSAQHMSIDAVTRAVMLMSVVIALRWPVGIYMGVAIGAHRLTLVSILNLVGAMGANGFGVLAVWQTRRIEALFIVQAVVAALQVFAFRKAAWQSIGRPENPNWTLEPLRTVWRFSAGMAAITLVAVALSQLDKILVSRFLPLQAFGLYALANVVGRTLYGLINPIYNIVHPRFSAMVANEQFVLLEERYLMWTGLFCAIFFPASMALAAGSFPLLKLWVADGVVAKSAAPLVSLIAIGSALHGAMYFPFALQVGVGDSRTPLFINLIMLAAYAPMLMALMLWQGVTGAALAWPATMTLYTLVGTVMTHRRILPGAALRWIVLEVGLPLFICGSLGAALHLLVNETMMLPWIGIGIVAAGTSLATLLCLALVLVRHPVLLSVLRERLGVRSLLPRIEQ